MKHCRKRNRLVFLKVSQIGFGNKQKQNLWIYKFNFSINVFKKKTVLRNQTNSLNKDSLAYVNNKLDTQIIFVYLLLVTYLTPGITKNYRLSNGKRII